MPGLVILQQELRLGVGEGSYQLPPYEHFENLVYNEPNIIFCKILYDALRIYKKHVRLLLK